MMDEKDLPPESLVAKARRQLEQRLRGLTWHRIVALASTVILVGYLLISLATNWRELLAYEWRISPAHLLASLLAYLGSLILGALAWHRMVWSMDRRVATRKGVKFFLQANPAKRVPGLIWYALGRIYLYEREGVTKTTVSIALSLELVTMILGGVLVYLGTAWGGTLEVEALQQAWLLAPLAALLALLLWPQGLYRAANWLLNRLKRQPIVHQASRGNLIRWSLLQAGAWVSGGLFIFFLAAGLYPDLGWSHMVPVVRSWAASGLVAMVALIVPLGLGLKETAFAYLLAALVPWPVAVSISLLGRFCSIIGDCVGLLLASRL